MRKLLVGLGVVGLVLLGFTGPSGAAPGEDDFRYNITCQGMGVYGSPEMLPQPWSSVYELPDVSASGPGAFIIRLQLVDDYGVPSYIDRPTGAIQASSGRNWTAASMCVAVPNPMPTGQVLLTKVDGNLIGLFGYAYDPGTSEPVTVSITVDGVVRHQRWASNRAWVSTPTFPAEATDKSFLILVGEVPAGDHEVCVTAHDTTPPGTLRIGAVGSTEIGCARLVVK